MLISWLRPWGGVTLLVVVLGMIVFFPARRTLRLIALPLTAIVAPLVYYAVIAAVGASWSLTALQTSFSLSTPWLLVAVLAPLAIPALVARSDPPDDQGRILKLWLIGAAFAFAVLGPGSRLAALEGLSLPLGILAVRGWSRIGAPRALGILSSCWSRCRGWASRPRPSTTRCAPTVRRTR